MRSIDLLYVIYLCYNIISQYQYNLRKEESLKFLDLAKNRYSVRSFSDKKVEEEKLERVLEAARIAPSARNLQANRILVFKSEDSLSKIDQLTRGRFNAPLVLVFGYLDNVIEADEKRGSVDSSICASHAMFQAEEDGLGTCWVASPEFYTENN